MQKEKRGAGMEKEEGAIESPCRQQRFQISMGLAHAWHINASQDLLAIFLFPFLHSLPDLAFETELPRAKKKQVCQVVSPLRKARTQRQWPHLLHGRSTASTPPRALSKESCLLSKMSPPPYSAVSLSHHLSTLPKM